MSRRQPGGGGEDSGGGDETSARKMLRMLSTQNESRCIHFHFDPKIVSRNRDDDSVLREKLAARREATANIG
jgi:hypothetical protein